MTRSRTSLAAALAMLVLVGCSGSDPDRDALLERIEAWTTEDSILSVVRNRDPYNLGGPTFSQDIEQFVARSSVSSFWPIELPVGIELRAARLTLVEGEPEQFDAAFADVVRAAEFHWQVVEGEGDTLTPADSDTLSLRDGVLIRSWARAGLAWRNVEASGCGHVLLATFPIDMFSSEDIQRAVGRQFIDCQS